MGFSPDKFLFLSKKSNPIPDTCSWSSISKGLGEKSQIIWNKGTRPDVDTVLNIERTNIEALPIKPHD